MNTVFSIIIPTYNRANLIGETLESVLNQDFDQWECIVIDDGSSDNTEAVVNKFVMRDSRIKFFHRPPHLPKGANSCRNFGFEQSIGDYINWFDSDDLYTPNALKTIFKTFTSDEDAVICKVEFVNLLTNETIRENVIFSDDLLKDYFLGNVAFYVSGPFWKRSFLEQQQYLFDTKISNLDDWDFNLRMLYIKPKIKFLDQKLIQYRIHENSLSKEITKFNVLEIKSDLNTREKHLQLNIASKEVDEVFIKKDIRNKCKYYLRSFLVHDAKGKSYLFQKLLKYEAALLNVKGIVKLILGFMAYAICKRGYYKLLS